LAVNAGRGSFSLALKDLADGHRLAAFAPGSSYLSIADLKRLRETEGVLRPRRLLLLDRDGVINRKAHRGEYVSTREQFKWIPETLDALQRLASEGFEFIILSNQAGIGRGKMRAKAVASLHEWMVQELAKRGILILDVLVCPHHWDDRCSCRKPKPGLFFQASEKYGFWLEHTIYVGDDPRDSEAAQNAGCLCLLVGEEAGHLATTAASRYSHTLDESVPWIVERYRKWSAST
jgi:D-glycero-D-manno-heptose 1,7-bisphosphate phosphatase